MLFYFIGLTGVGKSTVGKRVAGLMKYSFIDLDALIEIRNGMRISEIFNYGEESFRIAETEALKSLDPKSNHIVATGGGIVTRPENIALMKKTGSVILLDRPVEEITKTLSIKRRPLLKNKSDLYRMYEDRKNAYLSAYDLVYSLKEGYFDIDKIAADLLEIAKRGEK